MKKLMLLLMMAGVVGMAYGLNPDSFEISCTPSLTYAVTISTPAGGLTFTGVAPNTTYVNSSTATVTNSGNVSADWKIKGTELNNWTLGAASGSNIVRLLGALKSVIAVSGDFSTTDDLITTAEREMNNIQHTVDQTGNDVTISDQRLLSIRLDSPTDSTYETVQKFRVEIKAYPSSTF